MSSVRTISAMHVHCTLYITHALAIAQLLLLIVIIRVLEKQVRAVEEVDQVSDLSSFDRIIILHHHHHNCVHHDHHLCGKTGESCGGADCRDRVGPTDRPAGAL